MEVLSGEVQSEMMSHYPTTPTLTHMLTMITGVYSVSWPWHQENDNENCSRIPCHVKIPLAIRKTVNCLKDVGKRDFHLLLVGVYIGKIIMDNSMRVLQRTKSKITTTHYPIIKIDTWPRASVLPLFLFLWQSALKKGNLGEEVFIKLKILVYSPSQWESRGRDLKQLLTEEEVHTLLLFISLSWF